MTNDKIHKEDLKTIYASKTRTLVDNNNFMLNLSDFNFLWSNKISVNEDGKHSKCQGQQPWFPNAEK